MYINIGIAKLNNCWFSIKFKTLKKNVKENITFDLCILLLKTNKQLTPLECHDIFTIYGI